MRGSIASLVIAIYAGVATAGNCAQQPNSGGPEGNPIYSPGLSSQVPVGIPYDITWHPTTTGTVSIVLLRGPSTNAQPYDCIVENLANTGEYSWTPSTALENDKTHWGLRIMVDGTGQYQYSTQFGISNPNSPSPSSSGHTETATATSKHILATTHNEYATTTGEASKHAIATTPSEYATPTGEASKSVPYVYGGNTTYHYSTNSTKYTPPSHISSFSHYHNTVSSGYTSDHQKTFTRTASSAASTLATSQSLSPQTSPKTSVAVVQAASPSTTSSTPPQKASTAVTAAAMDDVRVCFGAVIAGLAAIAAFVL